MLKTRIDTREVEALVAKKFVTRREHPTLPLDIYNYTPKALYDLQPVEWGETLSWCRGLVLAREDGGVVARPFRKFWNLSQVQDSLPPGQPTFYEKVDGSLIIAFLYLGELVLATRGSFQSDQAERARQIVKEKYPHLAAELKDTHTYLFEVVYPENRIVVDYHGYEGFRLLAVLRTEDGTDDWDEFMRIAGWSGMPTAQRYPSMTIAVAKQINGDVSDFPHGVPCVTRSPVNGEEAEGFVLVWPNGFRAKYKFDDYTRLHRLLTGLTARDLWEMLSTGHPEIIYEIKRMVPVAAFREWVDATVATIRKAYDAIADEAVSDYLWADAHGYTAKPRAEFAEWAKAQKYPHLLFALLDKRPIDEMIWKMVYPKHSTPFIKEDSN